MQPTQNQDPMNHGTHSEPSHPNHNPAPKSTLEKYQTFFAIIIAAVLVVAGILIAHFVPAKTGAGTGQPAGTALTQSSVRDSLVSVAKKIGINPKQFGVCLDDKTNEQKIADAVALAQKSGVQGTPTFFILKRTFRSDGTVASQKQFTVLGARDESTFLKAITDGKAPADQPTQPTGEKIALSDSDHYLGPKNAETVIVEYADIDCPFCKAARPVIDKIMKDHPEYAHVFRHSPIASLHPWAEYKAAGAECATTLGGEEAFWKYLTATMK